MSTKPKKQNTNTNKPEFQPILTPEETDSWYTELRNFTNKFADKVAEAHKYPDAFRPTVAGVLKKMMFNVVPRDFKERKMKRMMEEQKEDANKKTEKSSPAN